LADRVAAAEARLMRRLRVWEGAGAGGGSVSIGVW